MRFWANSAILIFFTVFSFSSFAQNKNAAVSNSENNIVAEFKGEKITSAEFESAFNKVGIPKKENKNDSLAEKRKFLELYVNYRMKIKDAGLKGLDKDPEVIREYNDYRRDIGVDVLVGNEILLPGVKKMYERRKYEIHVAQLYMKLDSSKADFGYSKMKGIFDRIKAGEKFEEMVKTFSEDANSRDKGGDLYFLTSGDVNIPEIEDSLYATEPGKICDKIFKIGQGFYILKVLERQPRVYAMNVSHIMALYKKGNNAPDTLAAKKKILEAQQALKDGMSFEQAVKKYSEDEPSADKGGVIGNISRGRFLREFEEKVLNMKENEISNIIETRYGLHIAKVNSIVPYPTLAELEETLKKAYKNVHYQTDLEKYSLGLRKEFNYGINTSLYYKLIAVKDSFKIGDDFFLSNIKDKYKDSLFVTVNGKSYVADSVFNYMLKSGEIAGKPYNKNMLDLAHNRYVLTILLAEKANKVLSGTPAFEQTMKDYLDGILLFKVSEKEIWNNTKVDTTQIPVYWEQTRNNYLTKPRATFRELHFTNEKLRDSVFTALKNGADFDSMIKKSERSTSSTPIDKNIDENELAKRAYNLKNVGDITEPFFYGGGWSILRLDKREEKRPKTLEEAKPEVIAALQEKETKRLEETYVARLKDMFNPKIYPENIKN